MAWGDHLLIQIFSFTIGIFSLNHCFSVVSESHKTVFSFCSMLKHTGLFSKTFHFIFPVVGLKQSHTIVVFEMKRTAAKASHFHFHLCTQIKFYHRYELLHDIFLTLVFTVIPHIPHSNWQIIVYRVTGKLNLGQKLGSIQETFSHVT